VATTSTIAAAMIELKQRPIIIISRLRFQADHGRETQMKPLYCWR
jgi:hypothetical protein